MIYVPTEYCKCNYIYNCLPDTIVKGNLLLGSLILLIDSVSVNADASKIQVTSPDQFVKIIGHVDDKGRHVMQKCYPENRSFSRKIFSKFACLS